MLCGGAGGVGSEALPESFPSGPSSRGLPAAALWGHHPSYRLKAARRYHIPIKVYKESRLRARPTTCYCSGAARQNLSRIRTENASRKASLPLSDQNN